MRGCSGRQTGSPRHGATTSTCVPTEPTWVGAYDVGMPPRHHRTVDRVVAILEMVARHGRDLSLSTISRELDAPRSSVQALTNGLVAAGYLVEHDQKLSLGAGPFVLTLMGNRIAALGLTHSTLEELHRKVGFSVMVGVGVGDSMVYVDQVGDSPTLEFVARNHSRRSLYATASGKIILAELPYKEMDSLLLSAPHSEAAAVQAFLTELPEIRRTKLAYNLGKTIPGAYAVATPLIDKQGDFVAAICTTVDQERVDEIEGIGEQLKQAVSEVAI